MRGMSVIQDVCLRYACGCAGENRYPAGATGREGYGGSDSYMRMTARAVTAGRVCLPDIFTNSHQPGA